jgi:hypothetical protein
VGLVHKGHLSDPVDRYPVGRPKETLTNIELPPKEKLNNFEIRIPTHSTESKPGGNSSPRVNQDRTKDPQLAQSANNESTSHKRSASQEELNTKNFKKIKAFLARAAKVDNISELDAIEMGFAATILKEGDVETSVPIPTSYEAAINDKVYGEKWRTAIQEQLKALEINGT